MIYTIVLKDTDNSGNSVINGVISFDCIKSFSESRSATVSTQTVEKGFNISDNINIEPVQFSLDGYVSSYHLLGTKYEITWDGTQFKSNNNQANYNHARVRDLLIDFFEQKNVFTLMESEYSGFRDDDQEAYNEQKRGYYKEHENCVLTNMDFSVPEASSEVFSISMKIQKITIAVVEERQLESGEIGVLQKYKPNTDLSSVTSTTTDASSSKDDNLSEADVKSADPTKVVDDKKNQAKKTPTLTDISGGQSWESGYSTYKPTIDKLEKEVKDLEMQVATQRQLNGQ